MIVAGFGYRSGATPASLQSALARAQALAAPATHAATLPDKLPLLLALGLPVIAAEPVDGIDTPTRSAASVAARGLGSVAEAVALAAAGPGARLIVTRQISGDRLATCALAQGTPA